MRTNLIECNERAPLGFISCFLSRQVEVAANKYSVLFSMQFYENVDNATLCTEIFTAKSIIFQHFFTIG
jgi:hypothetical protein